MLRFFIQSDAENWSLYVKPVMFALNVAFNRSIGDSPYFLVFGQDPNLPFEAFSKKERIPVTDINACKAVLCNINRRVFDTVRKFLKRAQEENATSYNKKHKVSELPIAVGMRVYVKRLVPRQHKLQTRYIGPFRVEKVMQSGVLLRSVTHGKVIKVHKDYVLVPELSMATYEVDWEYEPFPSFDVNLLEEFHD